MYIAHLLGGSAVKVANRQNADLAGLELMHTYGTFLAHIVTFKVKSLVNKRGLICLFTLQ